MKIKNKYLIEIERNKIYSRHKKNIFYARNGAAIYITKEKLLIKKYLIITLYLLRWIVFFS